MLIKNTMRKIKKSLGRYLSLLLIVLIGVSFYAGIQQSIPQLRNVQNKYYKQTRLADYKIQSNLGLVNEDVDALKQIDGVERSIGTYSQAVLDGDKAIMVHAIEKSMNGYRLIKGREPTNNNECLADSHHYEIGDVVTISEGKDENNLKIKEFQVVGIIESPLYSGNDYGSTSIGDGELYSFIFVNKECFDYEVYTEIYLLMNKTDDEFIYSSDYESLIKKTNQEIESIQTIEEKRRYDDIYDEAYQEIVDGEKELIDEIKKANQEFDKAQKEIDTNRKKLNNGQKELDSQKQQALQKLDSAQKELDVQKQQLLNAQKEFETNQKQVQEQLQQAQKQKENLQVQSQQINQSLQLIDQQLENETLDEVTRTQLLKQKQELEMTLSSLTDAITQIDQQIQNANTELQSAKAQIEQGLKAIDEGQKTLNQQKQQTNVQLNNAQKEIDDGLNQLNEGQNTLNNNKTKFEKEIQKAQKDIQEGKDELAKLEKASWYVFERDNFVNGYTVLETQCDKVSIIANIIPAFFIAIVVLMTSNTMARMIVEERGEMGTLSSLGISNQQIIKSYMLYVLSSTSLGAILGYFIGTILIPPLVYICIPSILPSLEYIFDFIQLILVVIVSCFVMFVVTFVASQKELRQTPATLLRPVPPKNGKTILLERIQLIWSRLSFSWKITMRNIARYKKRVFITMVASASCTFIVIIGFAIKDSIQDVGVKQYHDIFQYENMVILDDSIDQLEDDLKVTIDSYIQNPLLINQSSVTVVDQDHSLSAYMLVPQDETLFKDYFVLKDVSTSEIISLDDEGVVISRNVAEGFSLNVGDEMTISDEDNHQYHVQVSGIVDNYVSCYIYMSPVLYQKIIQKDLSYNTVFGVNKGSQKTVSQNILTNDDVISVQFATELLKKANNGIEGLNNIVVLLVVIASLLDVTVLYNLTSINISERMREISTLKVLGFSDNESNQYIYRETMTIIIIGIILGLILTYPFFNMIIDLLESEQMMFLRQIKTASYIYATFITFFFAIVMQIVTYFKLKKVDMIESLKSVE